MRRGCHTGLFASLVLTAAALIVTAAPSLPAAASGQVCMGVVVDNGSGAQATPQAAQVPPGSSDLDGLSAAGDTFTQNNSGLVCAINSYPTNGLQNCLAAANGLYYYWSYWEGDPYTDTWTYAEVGPAEHTVSAGQTYVEGWRYQDPGADSPAATKPSVTPAAAFAQACPGVTPVPKSGGGAASAGGGSGGPATTDTTARATSPNPPSSSAAPGASTPAAGISGSHSVTSTTAARPASGTGSSPPGAGTDPHSTTSTSSAAGSGGPGPKATSRAALSNTTEHKTGSGGAPALPIVLVALLVVLLGAAAWFRWRRRAAEE